MGKGGLRKLSMDNRVARDGVVAPRLASVVRLTNRIMVTWSERRMSGDANRANSSETWKIEMAEPLSRRRPSGSPRAPRRDSPTHI